jgi:hypothetical protein
MHPSMRYRVHSSNSSAPLNKTRLAPLPTPPQELGLPPQPTSAVSPFQRTNLVLSGVTTVLSRSRLESPDRDFLGDRMGHSVGTEPCSCECGCRGPTASSRWAFETYGFTYGLFWGARGQSADFSLSEGYPQADTARAHTHEHGAAGAGTGVLRCMSALTKSAMPGGLRYCFHSAISCVSPVRSCLL